MTTATTSLLDRFRLDGKVAVVTGSGRGIGRGIAIGLADCGADIVVTARRTNEIDEVVAEVEARGRRAVGIAGDITDADVVRSLVDRAVAEMGRLDIWVSNAGGSEYKGSYPTLEMPDEHWDAQIALNLRPHFIAAKACAKVMQPGSSIIGISSTATLGPSPGKRPPQRWLSKTPDRFRSAHKPTIASASSARKPITRSRRNWRPSTRSRTP